MTRKTAAILVCHYSETLSNLILGNSRHCGRQSKVDENGGKKEKEREREIERAHKNKLKVN